MKQYPNTAPEYLARMETLVREVNQQSDRGAAIIATAWLEEAMTEALRTVMHDDSNAWKRLFELNGPMGTFSSKTDLACLIGLISEPIKFDLHAIRKVRNRFAHEFAHKKTHGELSFDATDIRDQCLALRCVEAEQWKEPRTAFLRACAVLVADFEMVSFWGQKLTGVGQITIRSSP